MHIKKGGTLAAAVGMGVVLMSPLHGLAMTSAARLGGKVSAFLTTAPTLVTISGPTSLTIGSTAQYTATVVGSTDTSVTWQVNAITGGNSTYGTISKTGLYTPPAKVPAANSIVISAYSNYNELAGKLSATLLYPAPTITSVLSSTSDGGQTFLVNVYGTSFMSNAVLSIGGVRVPIIAPAAGQLQTTIANPGGGTLKVSLMVVNPSPSVLHSNPYTVSLAPYQASPSAAARFLDQATFGPTASMISSVEQIGLQAALTQQFNQPATQYSQPPFPQTECVPTSSNFCETQSEFLSIAGWGNDQLRQRVAMALSEIWVSPNVQANAMPYYLNLLSQDAFGNYRTLMTDVTLSPNMGYYLNMANSPVAPSGQIANENYARELMQLFTLGLSLLNPDGSLQTDSSGNPIPTYSEAQVQAFARVFTGWTYANPDGSVPALFNSPRNFQHAMVAVEWQHDETVKTLLNGTTLPAGQTAEEDLQGALDNIFAHPNVGPFVSRQLIQHLVSGNPSPAYVERVAAVFDNDGNGIRGDMKAVISAILMDEEARAGDNQSGDEMESAPANPAGGHLREPLLWTANVIRGLNGVLTNPADKYFLGNYMGTQMTPMEETPFGQSDVFNFFHTEYVIPQTTINSPEFELENTGTVAPRQTRADQLVANQVPGLLIDLTPTSAIGKLAITPAALVDYLGMIFMHSQMPSDMRTLIINEVASIPATQLVMRAQVAAYLVVSSSQYKVIH
jgi:uncharacterized protein (DUF1800 family)